MRLVYGQFPDEFGAAIPPRLAESRQTASGPLRPLAKVTGAAAQLHQTGHSCIVQQFEMASDDCADEVDFGSVVFASSCRVTSGFLADRFTASKV